MSVVPSGEEQISTSDLMPEIHKVITTYFPENMQLSDYRNDAGRIYNKIEVLEARLEKKDYNLMLSPKEFNEKIDEIVKEIHHLYSNIEKIQKLKVQDIDAVRI